MKRRPVWRSAESSSGASAGALDGPELACSGEAGHPSWISPYRGVRGARVDIRQQRHAARSSGHQYPKHGTCKIADRPATDWSDPPWERELSVLAIVSTCTLLIFLRAGVFLHIFSYQPPNRRCRNQRPVPPDGAVP